MELRRSGISYIQWKRKANWIGHVVWRKCLLKPVIEGKTQGRIEVKGRRRRESKQLLDEVKEVRSYWELKKEALDRNMEKTRFGRDYGHFVRQATEGTGE
jgi:hypothetical protein